MVHKLSQLTQFQPRYRAPAGPVPKCELTEEVNLVLNEPTLLINNENRKHLETIFCSVAESQGTMLADYFLLELVSENYDKDGWEDLLISTLLINGAFSKLQKVSFHVNKDKENKIERVGGGVTREFQKGNNYTDGFVTGAAKVNNEKREIIALKVSCQTKPNQNLIQTLKVKQRHINGCEGNNNENCEKGQFECPISLQCEDRENSVWLPNESDDLVWKINTDTNEGYIETTSKRTFGTCFTRSSLQELLSRDPDAVNPITRRKFTELDKIAINGAGILIEVKEE